MTEAEAKNTNDERDPPACGSDACTGEGCGEDVDTVEALIARLEAERDDALALRQRALADYANFQRRSVENEARARHFGIAGFARALMPVLDHFDLTASQDLSKLTVEQIAKSVTMTRTELQRALEQQGLAKIEPDVGAEFDPTQHEAVTQMLAEGVGSGKIAMRFQVGWRLGESVLRPAKVAVTPTE
ncbi:MAG: nucleotide exchange factor GrpE [Phycisphaerales bacterium]|nr:nucleotide exchange factor GrpE [Phycisphaerales bacterium]